MIERLLNHKEVAEKLGVSVNTWRTMRNEEPKPVMFAKNLYRPSDLEKWLEERSRKRKVG